MSKTEIRTYRPNARVMFTSLDNDEAVLLDLDTKRYYTLNETGSRIWRLIADSKSISDISASLADEYAIETDVARSYVIEFLEDLHQDGLVEKARTNGAT